MFLRVKSEAVVNIHNQQTNKCRSLNKWNIMLSLKEIGHI
jgi:hypothetical protein